MSTPTRPVAAAPQADGAPGWLARPAVLLAFFALLFALLCALRMPLADRPIRDVDEAVSSIIASEWLQGGVPYRDAIDQRGPVTYALYALTYVVAGDHNMTAIHWALLLLIFAGCILLYRFGAALGGALLTAGGGPDLAIGPDLATGYLAALLTAIASFTYRRSQMLAFHTEWPVLIASSVGMLLLWRTLRGDERGDRVSPWLLTAAGLCFGTAFLSKQPAVFDGFAAGAFLLAWQARRHRFWSSETLARACMLAGGFFAALGLTAAYFAAHGALGDAYLYFWQYNVEHYAAVVPAADKIGGLNPFAHSRHYLTANPLLLLAGSVALVRFVVDWILRGWRAIDGRAMLALWFAGAYFGASYSGRNFGHYFIQVIAPACLLTALLLREGWLAAPRLARMAPLLPRLARAALVVAVLAGLAYPLYRFRHDMALFTWNEPARPKVAQDALVAYVAEQTAPDDRIFVWGYNPEIYVLADRRPATRFSNTNYLTGMLPWENHLPEIDTSEHIVDGGWEQLFAELAANPPELLIDTVPGNHRFYRKYPMEKFPRLAAYVAEHYRLETRILDPKNRPYYDVYRRR
jgi:hypothetical protein